MTSKTLFPWTLALLFAFGCGGAPEPIETAETASQESPVEPEIAEDPLLLDVRNARRPLPGILTGGQPTEEQLATAREAGFRTLVNLRPADEEGAWDEGSRAAEIGLDYVSIPIRGVEDLTIENALRLAEVVDDPDRQPVFVHCASGNRVGGLFAIKAYHVDGETTAAALQLGSDAGLTSMRAAVEGLLPSDTPLGDEAGGDNPG